MSDLGEMHTLYFAFSATRLLVTLLTELKSAVGDLRTQVAMNTQMLQTLTSSAPDTVDDDDFELPIADKPALESLEQDLLQNKSCAKSLVNY